MSGNWVVESSSKANVVSARVGVLAQGAPKLWIELKKEIGDAIRQFSAIQGHDATSEEIGENCLVVTVKRRRNREVDPELRVEISFDEQRKSFIASYSDKRPHIEGTIELRSGTLEIRVGTKSYSAERFAQLILEPTFFPELHDQELGGSA